MLLMDPDPEININNLYKTVKTILLCKNRMFTKQEDTDITRLVINCSKKYIFSITLSRKADFVLFYFVVNFFYKFPFVICKRTTRTRPKREGNVARIIRWQPPFNTHSKYQRQRPHLF